MKRETVKVLVTGKSGTGKTSIAYLIRETLEAAGFSASLYDDDELPQVDTVITRLSSLKELVDVEIETRATRSPVPYIITDV